MFFNIGTRENIHDGDSCSQQTGYKRGKDGGLDGEQTFCIYISVSTVGLSKAVQKGFKKMWQKTCDQEHDNDSAQNHTELRPLAVIRNICSWIHPFEQQAQKNKQKNFSSNVQYK